jgi:putative ABC transport system substrate-binding protein
MDRRGAFSTNRRTFVGAVASSLLTGQLAQAQQLRKVYRIGYLSTPTRQSVENALEAFLRALRELGWVEGQNLIIEYRWADGNVERLPGLATDLATHHVDLIVAPAASAALAAKNATSSIPIVMMFPTDPVELGLVTSLSRPGGNVTGTTYAPDSGFMGKQLELLKEAVPRATRIAILWNPADPGNAPHLKELLEASARAMRITLQHIEASGLEDYDRAFAATARERTEALMTSGSSTFTAHRQKLAELALTARLPTMSGYREMVEAGTLMAYGVNMINFIGRSARYVDKILRGAKPADLPVEQPTQFELVINGTTAQALGITIPQSLRLRAEVI